MAGATIHASLLTAALLLLAGCTVPSVKDGVEAASPNGASEVVVDMKNVAFAPATITVAPGTTVTWVNKEPIGHTVTPANKALWGTPGSGDAVDDWLGNGESWSYTFTEPGTYDYYCLPHAAKDAHGVWQGMVGTVIVKAGAAGPTGAGAVEAAGPGPAKAVDVAEIGRDAMDVPAPITRTTPAAVTFDITSREVVAEMADGTTYTYWTFDGTVPGPMLRVRQGDTVTINHHNDASSTMAHNIDFHAVTGPGGGAGVLRAQPGETATLTFKARNPGLFIYHCAYQDPPLHIAMGMYGLILVEPAGGMPPVDKEFYVVQGDFYSPFGYAEKGHHTFDSGRADDERPTFVVFNGRVGSLKDEDRQLQAEVGDRVRMFVGVGGPNLVSSFHVIGEIFDRVWDQGSLVKPPQEHVQTTLVPAGGATMVEFDLEVPGDFFLVDHSINRVHKGAFGVLHVEGEDDPDTFREGS